MVYAQCILSTLFIALELNGESYQVQVVQLFTRLVILSFYMKIFNMENQCNNNTLLSLSLLVVCTHFRETCLKTATCCSLSLSLYSIPIFDIYPIIYIFLIRSLCLLARTLCELRVHCMRFFSWLSNCTSFSHQPVCRGALIVYCFPTCQSISESNQLVDRVCRCMRLFAMDFKPKTNPRWHILKIHSK